MIVFPNCKINLGLHILNKREDGYHNLETVFYPVQLRDALEVVRRDDGRQSIDDSETIHHLPLTTHISFSSTGLPIAGDEANNLCIKAYRLLKKDFPALPPVQMHLHKAIPMGAGLGGGSADGAFALKLLNDKFQLGLFFFSQFWFLVLAIVLLAFQFQWMIVTGIIVFRYLFTWISLGYAAGKLKEKDVMYWYPIIEIVLIFTQLSVFFRNLISKPVHWK